MSKRDSASRPLYLPRSPHPNTLPSIRSRDEVEESSSSSNQRNDQPSYGNASRTSESVQKGGPPQPYRPTMPPRPLSTSTRSLGVHSMLNPEFEPTDPPHHQYSSDQRQSPLVPRSFFNSATSPGRSSSPSQQRSFPSISPFLREAQESRPEPRKILVPRSPRTSFYGSRNTLESHQSGQFLPSPAPGSHSVAGTAVPEGQVPPREQTTLGYGYVPPPPSEPLRKRSSVTSITREGRQSFQTESMSPTPSLTSSYGSQSANLRSLNPAQPGSMQSLQFSSSLQEAGHDSIAHASGTSGDQGPFPSESSILLQGTQANMRMMPLTSADGTQFYVPVDVQAASKVADEKRARNAGASARFRERRKVKEKEATTAIQKLEAQNRELERRNKDLEKQLSFYQNDRDRLRDIVQRTPGISHFAGQEASQVSDARYPPSHQPLSATTPWEEFGADPMESMGRPAQRRRTEEHGNNYTPYAYAPPTSERGYSTTSEPATRAPTLPPMRPDVSTPRQGTMPSGPPIPPHNRPIYEPFQRQDAGERDHHGRAGERAPPK